MLTRSQQHQRQRKQLIRTRTSTRWMARSHHSRPRLRHLGVRTKTNTTISGHQKNHLKTVSKPKHRLQTYQTEDNSAMHSTEMKQTFVTYWSRDLYLQPSHCCSTAATATATVCLNFTAIFSGGTELAGTRMSPFWILLELRITDIAVTTGAIRCAKLQSYRHY